MPVQCHDVLVDATQPGTKDQQLSYDISCFTFLCRGILPADMLSAMETHKKTRGHDFIW